MYFQQVDSQTMDTPLQITYCCCGFLRALTPLFCKQRGSPNLLPTQRRLLQELQQHDKIIVVDCD